MLQWILGSKAVSEAVVKARYMIRCTDMLLETGVFQGRAIINRCIERS